MEKAEAWLQRAMDAAGSRAPLKKLRELLHAGVRLGADVPQVCCVLLVLLRAARRAGAVGHLVTKCRASCASMTGLATSQEKARSGRQPQCTGQA